MWYRCLDSHLRSVRPFVVVVCIEIGNAVGKCWARGFFRGHEKENEPKQEMKCETTTGVIAYSSQNTGLLCNWMRIQSLASTYLGGIVSPVGERPS